MLDKIGVEMKKNINKFDPARPRAIAGLDFQKRVMEKLLNTRGVKNVEDVREWLKKTNKNYTEYDLNIGERFHGDITFILEGERYFVECCLAMGEKSKMSESKRRMFKGRNKWYCWGRSDDLEFLCFVPSLMWSKYSKKLGMIAREGTVFRLVPRSILGSNLKAARLNCDEFVASCKFK